MKLIVLLFSFLLLATPIFSQVAEQAPKEEGKSPEDLALTEKLERIFAEIEAFEGISVDVTAGVVTLSGTTVSSETEKEALELVKKIDGVIYVEDQIQEEVEVASRLQPTVNRAREIGVATLRKLPLIGIALSIILLAWLLGNIVRKQRWLYRRFGVNDLSGDLLGRVLKLIIIGIGLFLALEVLDATAVVAAILGVAGVVGIALGFAFRNIVENYLAGILLSLRNPFSTGDAVELEGFSGKVMRLTSRDTVLMTFDGNHLRIPNSLIMTSTLINFSRNPLRRFDFAVGVSVELDMVKVRELGLRTLDQLSSILDDPAPSVVIEALGDSTVNMRFFGWINQQENDFLKTKSEAIRLVKDAFDEAEIEMPEPIYRVVLRNPPSEEKPSAAAKTPNRSSQHIELDTSPDRSIDEQVEAAEAADREDNLLEDEPED